MLALLALLLLKDAPPPPQPPPPALAWACDRQSLLAGLRCTFEGKTRAQEPSKAQVDENQRQARALGLELCATAATGRAPQAIPAVKAACEKRLELEVAACGGDGSRRLLDDDGRFNPGHAVCYAALRAVTEVAQRSQDEAQGCCSCIDVGRGAAFNQCVADVDADRLPPGADKGCRSFCAAVLLRVVRAPAVSPSAAAR